MLIFNVVDFVVWALYSVQLSVSTSTPSCLDY